jgi:hypothetical protein
MRRLARASFFVLTRAALCYGVAAGSLRRSKSDVLLLGRRVGKVRGRRAFSLPGRRSGLILVVDALRGKESIIAARNAANLEL